MLGTAAECVVICTAAAWYVQPSVSYTTAALLMLSTICRIYDALAQLSPTTCYIHTNRASLLLCCNAQHSTLTSTTTGVIMILDIW
jgi:hypothetical protein